MLQTGNSNISCNSIPKSVCPSGIYWYSNQLYNNIPLDNTNHWPTNDLSDSYFVRLRLTPARANRAPLVDSSFKQLNKSHVSVKQQTMSYN